MSAIFGFTFHIGRMTEVLTPDIYRAHWFKSSFEMRLIYTCSLDCIRQSANRGRQIAAACKRTLKISVIKKLILFV